jgi:hypothetical protein
VQWDHRKVFVITETAPAAAHAVASQAAANAAADAIGGQGTGNLARDVRNVKGAGALFRGTALATRSMVGSSLPYARIQHFGGTIQARNVDAYGRVLLYIRPDDIQATKASVTIPGKRYLDAAPPVYMASLPAAYRARFPR